MVVPNELREPARAIAERLIVRKETLAVAESSAGGLISTALLAVPGASAYYRGGSVSYTLVNAVKMLSGDVTIPEGTRGASEPFATFLAKAIASKLETTWGIGEAGAAGPTGNRYGDPAGHAWVAVAGPSDALVCEHVLTGADDREGNMVAFAAAALRLLLSRLDG